VKRVQNSVGGIFKNEGSVIALNETKYELDLSRSFIVFDVVPMGAVRMTQSDRWKVDANHIDPRKRQRASVTKYFAFKTIISAQAKQMGFTLGRCLEAIYCIPMPNSWSEKKKKEMNGLPCLSKPDTDNITKAIKDALKKNDGDVWWEKAEKRWAFKGSIIIFI
jgi:Holliday junction resolvase RusA-like endonuclease